ncbi:10608_t:CDS:1, partial [Racocetra persica]
KLKQHYELRQLDFEDSLIKAALNNFCQNIYLNQFSNQFYHAFGKSQVVDIEKIQGSNDI